MRWGMGRSVGIDLFLKGSGGRGDESQGPCEVKGRYPGRGVTGPCSPGSWDGGPRRRESLTPLSWGSAQSSGLTEPALTMGTRLSTLCSGLWGEGWHPGR